MLFLDKATTFSLDHRAGIVRGASSPPPFVAAGGEGGVSVCQLTPRPSISRVTISREIGLVCPHPSKPLLALIERESGRLVLRRFDGAPVFEEDPPRLPEGSPEWMTTEYTDCRFDVSGTYLLCAARTSEDYIEVQLRETEGWSIVNRIVVADPFGGSAASFHAAARPELWALWLAAGQDGQCVYWLRCDGSSLHAAIEPSLENTVPPAFSPGGDEFLTIEVSGPLRRYRYPQAELLGTCESPYGAHDPFDISLCYLDKMRALAGSRDGRIAVVDTPTMRVVNEVIVEGHSPRPTEEYHPRLAGERQLCTDISYFERIGSHLIIVYPLHRPQQPGSDGRVKFEEWRDGLLCFPVDYVLEQYAA